MSMEYTLYEFRVFFTLSFFFFFKCFVEHSKYKICLMELVMRLMKMDITLAFY